MPTEQESRTATPVAGARPRTAAAPRWTRVALITGIVCLAFSRPLAHLGAFALHSELFSYVLVVPAVVGYFGWLRRRTVIGGPPDWLVAGAAALAGAVALASSWLIDYGSGTTTTLSISTAAFCLFVVAASALALGRTALRQLAFPLGFLFFLIPLPDAITAAFEAFLQESSAATASWLFRLVGTPVFIDHVWIKLPAFSMQVAPECSGIHSTLALLLTSTIAAQLCLRRTWSRIILVLVVIPLGIVRNAFRIVVIGELCVHVGPHMIDSYIHHHGGPIFFLLSLVPLVLILGALVRIEARRNRISPDPSVS